ncbi:alpha/beta fold hydrolase [Lampropedia cohaerens]|uniref:alpha/beta fold hydrolase n=1 Tax=Lampropedia cohaerens TaxID=1610491 RepID=UPI00069C85F1|nr:alpha/beta hydrolase [Lampropedia cohaerens]
MQRYRIQAHYLLHDCFLHWPAQLPQVINRLRTANLPVALVHGVQDRLCPADNARMLRHHLPASRLALVPHAGHDPWHPRMVQCWQSALQSVLRDGDFAGWEDGTP